MAVITSQDSSTTSIVYTTTTSPHPRRSRSDRSNIRPIRRRRRRRPPPFGDPPPPPPSSFPDAAFFGSSSVPPHRDARGYVRGRRSVHGAGAAFLVSAGSSDRHFHCFRGLDDCFWLSLSRKLAARFGVGIWNIAATRLGLPLASSRMDDLSAISEELAELDGQISDILRALA